MERGSRSLVLVIGAKIWDRASVVVVFYGFLMFLVSVLESASGSIHIHEFKNCGFSYLDLRQLNG